MILDKLSHPNATGGHHAIAMSNPAIASTDTAR